MWAWEGSEVAPTMASRSTYFKIAVKWRLKLRKRFLFSVLCHIISNHYWTGLSEEFPGKPSMCQFSSLSLVESPFSVMSPVALLVAVIGITSDMVQRFYELFLPVVFYFSVPFRFYLISIWHGLDHLWFVFTLFNLQVKTWRRAFGVTGIAQFKAVRYSTTPVSIVSTSCII